MGNWLLSPTSHVRPQSMQLGTSSVQVGLGSTWSIISAGLILNFWVMSNAHEATQACLFTGSRGISMGRKGCGALLSDFNYMTSC